MKFCAGAASLLLMLGVIGCAEPAPPDPSVGQNSPAKSAAWLVDEARERGLEFVYSPQPQGQFAMPEIIGAGLALFDMDDDGDLDLYALQAGPNQLFANDGTGHFTNVTEQLGGGETGYGMGVAAGDYDQDGDVDLYITNLGTDRLLQNRGEQGFADVTQRSGLGDAGWGTSATWIDIDRDGDLDLFVARYVEWRADADVECRNPQFEIDYCGPAAFDAPAGDLLYINEGDGFFVDRSSAWGLDRARGNGLGVIAADFDRDGWPDIFVANDATLNQLWINKQGLRLEDEALPRGCAMDLQGLAKAGMGVDATDLDHDADEELIVVNLRDETDSLYRNDGGLFYDDTLRLGLGIDSLRFTRFGVAWGDFDIDGRTDLFEANGRVLRRMERFGSDPYAEPNLLFLQQPDGRLVRGVDVGLDQRAATSRGATIGDIDSDGDLDIVVSNRESNLELWINQTPVKQKSWLGVDLRTQTGSPALGAEVRFESGDTLRFATVRASASYLSSNGTGVHWGFTEPLSDGTLYVRWPDGIEETRSISNFNQWNRIQRGRD